MKQTRMINLVEDSKGVAVFVRTDKVVSYQDMITGMDFIQNSHELPRELRIIEDAQGSEVTFSIKELKDLIDKMEVASRNYKSIKHAVVHDNPKNTAFALIVQKQKTSSNYNLQVFSSMEGAINWINFDGEL